MKNAHLIALLLTVVAVVLVYNLSEGNEITPYSNFTEAMETGKKVKLVGTLVKDKPMVYKPLEDPNKFTFYLKDEEGVERQVNLLKGKPQDFEMSESIVLDGRMTEGGMFLASDIQMKCPSKYKDEESLIKELTES